MGGLFGVIAKQKCVTDLFYGIDYHSHLGTKRGGMAVFNTDHTFARSIHSLEQSYFRIKFEGDLHKFDGNSGIGVISDGEAQPIAVNSHLGRFALASVSRVNNVSQLEEEVLSCGKNFTELSGGTTNPTELIAHIITEGKTFADGIRLVQKRIDGSCTMLILTPDGIIACRDFYGRTPLVVGKKDGAYAVASENCSFINLGYEDYYFLGPGEAVLLNENGLTQLIEPSKKLHICSFLWVYYGYAPSTFDNVNVDQARRNLGRIMGEQDDVEADMVSPIPDSGTCMALGYAEGKKIPFRNAIVKYTPTWPRSFMPQDQRLRDIVAKMKLIPNYSLMKGRKIVFCDDSIVRGTQLRDNVEIFKKHGAGEVHIRISCPPLIFACPYVNFSPSKKPTELITRRIIEKLEGADDKDLSAYATFGSEKYNIMVDEIRKQLKMTSLKFNSVDDLVKAIGLPKECVCTHCFDGSGND